MQTPNFANNQFVDQTALNTAFGAVSGSLATLAAETFALPGLLRPEWLSFSASGMVVTVQVPPPAGVVTGPGVVALAHGTTPGSDTQTYSVDFTSLVPASGSVTAYLIATAATVQQNPVGVPGPPPGHPSYNPNFVPTIGYASLTDTLALTASTSAPNNSTAFEVARTTLAAGQSSLPAGSLDTSHQLRAAGYDARQPILFNGSAVLPVTDTAGAFVVTVPGYTATLPSASSAAGLPLALFNASTGVWTIAASGSDQIYGVTGPSGLFFYQLPAQAALHLWSDGAAWRVWAASPNTVQGRLLVVYQFTSGSGTLPVVPSAASALIEIVGGGGGGGSTNPVTSGSAAAGGGGGAGAYLRCWMTSGFSGASYSVGAGGAAGSAGGSTSFASLLAPGGSFGASSNGSSTPVIGPGSAATAGPTTTGASQVLDAQPGAVGGATIIVNTANLGTLSGAGGSSPLGTGGAAAGLSGVGLTGADGNSGSGYGAGGGGSTNGSGDAGAHAGGSGSGGVVRVWLYS